MVEVSVSTKGSQFALLIPQRNFNELGLKPDAEYELVKVKKGIWVLIAKEKPQIKENSPDKKIFELIRQKSLHDRVEGKFEKFLGREELQRFKQLLREGSIVAFKLSPKYKKAVYKTKEEVEGGKESRRTGKRESESSNAGEKPFELYSLERDGFLVCKNTQKAKLLSEQLKKEIEVGKIRGIKSFDGFFYIAENALYQKYRQMALSLIKAEKGIGSAKIAEKIGISKILAKITCEFLKDDGEIIEKRKDQFQAI